MENAYLTRIRSEAEAAFRKIIEMEQQLERSVTFVVVPPAKTASAAKELQRLRVQEQRREWSRFLDQFAALAVDLQNLQVGALPC